MLLFRLVALVILAILLFPLMAFCQDVIKENTKVRISAPGMIGGIISGKLVRLDNDSVAVFTRRGLVVVPKDSIEHMSYVSGQTNKAVLGGVIGLPVGAVLGLGLSTGTCKNQGDNKGLCQLATTALGAGTGLILGIVIGASSKTEQWKSVDVNKVTLGVGMINGNTAGLKLSLSF